MRLRTQLAVALLLLAVLPLLGVTLYTYQTSLRAYRRAMMAEAEVLATDEAAKLARIRLVRKRTRPACRPFVCGAPPLYL